MIRRLILRLLVNAVAVYAAAYVVTGVDVASFGQAMVVAVILGVLNVLVRPFLLLITLPINLLTLGLFTLVINGAILTLAAVLTDAITVTSFGPAILAGLVISLVNWILGSAEGDD